MIAALESHAVAPKPNQTRQQDTSKTPQENPTQSSVRSYATVAKSALGKPATTATVAMQGGKSIVKGKPKKDEKSPQQLVLLTKKDQPLPPYSSKAIRDAVDKSILAASGDKIKGPIVASVATSTSNNIILTTTAPYNAQTLKETQPLWKEVFRGFPILNCQIQRPWIKLVAHGVPTEAAEDFQTECETYNPIRVKGAIRWLKKPTKTTGSMVFAIDTQEEQQYCLQNGLFIAGKRVIVVNFKTHSQYSQCPRCQGFGHNPTKCKKRIACKLCAGKHLTKNHSCNTCHASGNCPHLEEKCANCKGHHPANSPDCEILQAVRGKKTSPTLPAKTVAPTTADDEL